MAETATQAKVSKSQSVMDTFLQSFTDTNKAILDVLKSSGEQAPIYVSGPGQPISTAPNYILFVAIGIGLFLIIKKKVRL